jgi:hypothetical protein
MTTHRVLIEHPNGRKVRHASFTCRQFAEDCAKELRRLFHFTVLVETIR